MTLSSPGSTPARKSGSSGGPRFFNGRRRNTWGAAARIATPATSSPTSTGRLTDARQAWVRSSKGGRIGARGPASESWRDLVVHFQAPRQATSRPGPDSSGGHRPPVYHHGGSDHLDDSRR